MFTAGMVAGFSPTNKWSVLAESLTVKAMSVGEDSAITT
jgi:hypothetical protein